MSEQDNGTPPIDDDQDDGEQQAHSQQPVIFPDPQNDPDPQAVPAEAVGPQENPYKPAYQRMLKDIRIWGWSSTLLGVIQFVIAGILNPSWGIALFAVGGISFLINEASMFMVYAVIMAWVGLSNVLAGGIGGWTIFGVLQAYWSYQLYRRYQVYRIVEQKYLELETEPENLNNRAEDTFPGCGCAMSVAGLLGSVGIFFAVVLAVAIQESEIPLPANFQVIEFLLGTLLASGIVGLSLSVAALVAGYKRKWLAWGGAVAGGLLMAFEIYLRFTSI